MSLVSVIIPTYNRLDFLKIALESCLQQSVLPHKIIIGDDSSDNETEDWIKAFKTELPIEIKYTHNRPSLKQAANVEMLIQEVDTDYLLLLHDDDFLLQNALKDLLHTIERNPDVDVAFGKQYLVNIEGKIDEAGSASLNNMFCRTQDEEGVIRNSLSVIFRQQLPSNSFLVRTSLAKSLHYGEKEKAGNGVDFHFCYKLGLSGAIFAYKNVFVSCYRDSPDGISKYSDSGYYAFKLISEISTIHDREIDVMKQKCLKRLAPIAIIQAINHDKKKEARTIYFSKYHRKEILSFGGIKRGLKLIFYK